jgi:ribose 5-phosphate isomerase B
LENYRKPGGDMELILLASDHNGVGLKNEIKEVLMFNGFAVLDLGPFDSDTKVDYVDYANQLSNIISNADADKGILVCGTGVGMSIAANRHEQIRAALVHNQFTAPKCREHNDANVLCLGSWITPMEQTEQILSEWLQTDFGEGRHIKRVEKLSKKSNGIVFTNGVFDILHTGHIELLNFAKGLGDKLVVGINSDSSVKAIKGENRPINNQEDRKRILESLVAVDEVVIFDDITANSLREKISPDILVKGGEWTKEQVRKRDKVSEGIKIKIYPFVKNYSTTGLIKKIHGIETWEKDY